MTKIKTWRWDSETRKRNKRYSESTGRYGVFAGANGDGHYNWQCSCGRYRATYKTLAGANRAALKHGDSHGRAVGDVLRV